MNNTFDFSNARISNIGEPTGDQLELINKIAPKPVKAQDVFVFGSRASNSDYDSFHSVMDDSTLRNYADDFSQSRAFLAHHDDKDFPLGRTFDSHYEQTDGGLDVATYVTRGLHLNKVASDDFIRGVETGIAKDVSIRYKGGDEVCELCHNRVLSRSCDHMPGMRYDNKLATYRIIDGHALEMSTVFKGSNPKTSIIKARELFQRGLIDEKSISGWNLSHGCDLRSDFDSPAIISLSNDLQLLDNMRSYFEIPDAYWLRGDWDEASRKKAASEGDAFSDESYPIKTQKDVEDAEKLSGRSKSHSKEAVEEHIHKIAKKLGLKTSDSKDESRTYLERFNRVMADNKIRADDGKPTGDGDGDGDEDDKKAKAKKADAFKGSASERKICDIFMDWMETRGAKTSPDNLARIKDYLERAEKGDSPKPPYDAMQEHVDDDNANNNDAHTTNGQKINKHLAPARSFESLGDYLKTRSEMTSKAGPMATMAKGTPDAFNKGHTAGLMYPSTEPLQNPPSEVWHEVDGAPVPSDADKGAGAGVSSISNPMIEIRPDGTINLLLDGGAKVNGEASVNGVVPMRMEGSDTVVDMPFKSLIVPLRAEHLQELAGLASEGLAYRRSLEFDGLRFGMTRDEGKFDAELHMRIMRSLPGLNDLRSYVDTLKEGAIKKLAVSNTENKSLADFGMSTSRQTVPGNGVNEREIIKKRSEGIVIDNWDGFKV